MGNVVFQTVELQPGPVPFALSKRKPPNPNPKTCEIAKAYGPNVHFCDRNSAIWIWIFHKFHKRVHINKRRFFCFNILKFVNVLV